MEISDQQVAWLKKAVGIGRDDYSEAKSVQTWVYQILEGKDMTEEFEGYD